MTDSEIVHVFRQMAVQFHGWRARFERIGEDAGPFELLLDDELFQLFEFFIRFAREADDERRP